MFISTMLTLNRVRKLPVDSFDISCLTDYSTIRVLLVTDIARDTNHEHSPRLDCTTETSVETFPKPHLYRSGSVRLVQTLPGKQRGPKMYTKQDTYMINKAAQPSRYPSKPETRLICSN